MVFHYHLVLIARNYICMIDHFRSRFVCSYRCL